jgi:hypothetical protein
VATGTPNAERPTLNSEILRKQERYSYGKQHYDALDETPRRSVDSTDPSTNNENLPFEDH